MKKLLMMIATAAMLPLGVLAVALTPPSTRVDLTTNGSNPSGSVASSSDYSDTYNSANQYNGTKAFDGITNTKSENRWLPKKAANMWVVYTFNTATVVDSILVKLPGSGYSASARAPMDWTFQGSNDKSAWAVLDTQTGEKDWSDNESRYYKFSNTTAYKYYKFNCTANNGDANCMQVLELEFYCVGGANSTWTGGGTTDLLSDVANWGGSAMPGSEYAAHINDTGATPAAVPGGLTVYNALWVGSGASAKVVQTNGTVITRGATIGREGGTGEYCISGGEFIATNTTTYISARSGKDTGILNISGTADVKFIDVRLFSNSPSAGSTATIKISDNGKLTLGGDLDMGYGSIATTGMVYQTGGTFKETNNILVGNKNMSYGEYKMSGGTCSAANVFIGYAAGSSGLFEMTGGTCAVGAMMSVGRYGTGTLAISGADTVLTSQTVRVGFTNGSNNGTGTLVVTNGGEIATTQVYGGGTDTSQSTITFNEAKLTATAANAAFLKDLPNIQLEAGGLTIDTQGYALGIANCTFNVTGNGKITVVGGGAVTFTNVKVNMSAKPSGAYVFAETDGTFSGLPNLGGVNGCTILLSDDFKRVTVSPRGFIIAVF